MTFWQIGGIHRCSLRSWIWNVAMWAYTSNVGLHFKLWNYILH